MVSPLMSWGYALEKLHKLPIRKEFRRPVLDDHVRGDRLGLGIRDADAGFQGVQHGATGLYRWFLVDHLLEAPADGIDAQRLVLRVGKSLEEVRVHLRRPCDLEPRRDPPGFPELVPVLLARICVEET